MRALVVGFDSPYTYLVLQRLLEAARPEYFCLVHDREHYPDRPSLRVPSGVEFREEDVSTLQAGSFREKSHELPPLDETLLERMVFCEAIVLRMAERLNSPEVDGYDFRKTHYLKQLRYWHYFLKANRIDTVLMHTIPHSPITYVIYELCKLFGIRFLYCERTPILDTVFLVRDWERCGEQFGERYRELRANGIDAESIKLEPRFEEQYQAQTSKKRPYYWHVDDYLRKMEKSRQIATRLKTSATRFYRAFRDRPVEKLAQFANLDYWYGKKHSPRAKTRALEEFYAAHVSAPIDGEPFVYFPLHYQPEASTSPMCGVLVEQVLIVQMLHAALPPGWKLYLKEYRGQEALGRTLDFYKELLEPPNVKFMSTSASSLDLIHSCSAVVTGTGTAGWEALFRSKPVLLFGHCYYQYAPGIFHCGSAADCRKALEAVARGEGAATHAEMRLFLKAVEEKCANAFNEPLLESITKLTPQQNGDALAAAVLQELGVSLTG